MGSEVDEPELEGGVVMPDADVFEVDPGRVDADEPTVVVPAMV